MYGTIARMRAREGKEEELIALFERQRTSHFGTSGAISLYLLRLDADPREFIMVPIFDQRSSYVANAQSAAQGERSAAIRALLERDPLWHDGEIQMQTQSEARFDQVHYGTVGYIRLTKPAGAELEAYGRRAEPRGDEARGGVVYYIFRLDSDPRDLAILATWQSRELYHANAQSQEQDRRYQEFRAFMETDPVWHDGEIVPFHRF